MKQIFCEHPVIIRNPQLKELLITHRCYTTLNYYYETDLL
nr:MAG TPA: hypothetical protein [Microviridae sp.]